MKRILCSIGLSLIVSLMYGQFEAGAKTGIHISNIDMKGVTSGLKKYTEPLAGINVGVYGKYDFSKNISAELGVNYLSRGLRFEESTYANIFEIPLPVGFTMTLKSKYIDIPMTLRLNQNIGLVKAYAKVGGGLSQALSTKLKPQVNAWLDFNLPPMNIPTTSYNSSEFFGIGGLGVSYPLTKGSVFAEASYQHSFESVKPDFLVDLDLKNKGFSVGIGYAMSF